ncbi:predicted protein [Naegleria gruberi]|uniref:Predicted protein n=1 Tax=Naegleria gruberi TaxID=5762 RepID=D2V0E6_NAEGR|nr:uncharacterized protein NAEGRDRAFT_62268 [Naegleria gruberi]EFC49705.1 predicted protein [Naegleria gruberi]|eukprot:XP_002682449.1 predicted protein [Naegleria gruberi strain NEG-M]
MQQAEILVENTAATEGTSTLRSIGGATFVYKIITTGKQDLIIACDPVLCPKGHVQNYGLFKSTRMQEPALEGDADLLDVDLWLLTHGHEDHLDSFGLERILNGKKDSIVIAHPSVEGLMKKVLKQKDLTFGNRNVHWMSPAQDLKLEINGFDITLRSVNAFHGSCRKIGAMVGNGNGYLVSISSNGNHHSRFYATGDSIYNEDNISDDYKELSENPLDFIVTNGGEASMDKKKIIGAIATRVIGSITNNSKNIIEMHKKLKARKTLVVHHGTFSHYAEVLEDKTSSFDGNDDIEAVFPGETVVIV